MDRWWHLSWKRVAIGLAVVFCGLWIIGRALERMEPWIEARRIAHNYPGVSALPVAMPDVRLAKLVGDRVEYFGISLRVPWRGLGISRMDSNLVIIPFPEQNAAVTIFRPGTDEFERSMWADVCGHVKTEGLTSLGLMTQEMRATPNAVKWWRGHCENEAASFLLESKALKLNGANTVYTLVSGELRGFQEGNPGVSPFRVRLDLYDAKDRHYEIGISATKGRRPVISQSEINAMIASIRQVPAN